MRRWLLGVAGVVGILVVIYVFVFVSSSPYAPRPVLPLEAGAPRLTNTPTPTRLTIGQEGHLWAGTENQWYLATTIVTQDEYAKVLAAGDTIGFQELIRREKVFPVDRSTRLLVLEHYRDVTRVRVLEGPQSGKAGWIAFEHVR